MKSPLQKTRAALKRSRQNLAKLTASKRDATSGLPVFEADTYARSPSESSLTKAKRSDYNLKELSESSESSDEEAGPRLPRKADAKGRRSWALVLVAAACLGGAGYAATRAAKPTQILHADRSLRTATDLFRRAAAADGLRSAEFTRATDALNPFLEALHLGLAPLVRVNVVKLQNAGAEKTQDSIEALVRAERRAGWNAGRGAHPIDPVGASRPEQVLRGLEGGEAEDGGLGGGEAAAQRGGRGQDGDGRAEERVVGKVDHHADKGARRAANRDAQGEVVFKVWPVGGRDSGQRQRQPAEAQSCIVLQATSYKLQATSKQA